jgi:hypothetical protein
MQHAVSSMLIKCCFLSHEQSKLIIVMADAILLTCASCGLFPQVLDLETCAQEYIDMQSLVMCLCNSAAISG